MKTLFDDIVRGHTSYNFELKYSASRGCTKALYTSDSIVDILDLMAMIKSFWAELGVIHIIIIIVTKKIVTNDFWDIFIKILI